MNKDIKKWYCTIMVWLAASGAGVSFILKVIAPAIIFLVFAIIYIIYLKQK